MRGRDRRITFDPRRLFQRERPAETLRDGCRVALIGRGDRRHETERCFDDFRIAGEPAHRQHGGLYAGARGIAGMQRLGHRAHAASKAR